jgi:hypothetical protein
VPYVKEQLRKDIESWGELHHLVDYLKKITENGKVNSGMVTYVVYKIIKEVYGEGNFESMSNALKVLDSAKDEFLENILRPYEKLKKKENGDV